MELNPEPRSQRVPVPAPGLSLTPASAELPHAVASTPGGMVFELSPAAGHLLGLIDGSRTLAVLAAEQGRHHATLTEAQCEQIIDTVFVPKGLVAYDRAPTPVRPRSRLWLRIPVIPSRWVARAGRTLVGLYDRRIAVPLILLGLATTVWLVVVARTTEHLTPGQSLGWFAGVGLVYLTFAWHELGHAAALSARGRSPGTIGIGMYRFIPVFFTDVSEVAHLPGSQRAVVNLGGLYFQVMCSIPLAALYALTGHAAFAQAGWGIALSVAFNLNPFLRLDGYWVVQDLSGENNLQRGVRRTLGNAFRSRGRNLPASRVLRVYTLVVTTYVTGLTIWFVIGVLPRLIGQLESLVRGRG